MIGLLNSLLRERRSSFRFQPVETGDQIVWVAAGRREALRTAERSGLLPMGAADTAREEGQAFEEEVIERLQDAP